jgi:hypothetical protein
LPCDTGKCADLSRQTHPPGGRLSAGRLGRLHHAPDRRRAVEGPRRRRDRREQARRRRLDRLGVRRQGAPDGYTLLNQGNHAINKNLYKELRYDDKDFIPICRVANGATVLVVNNDTPFKSAKELIAYAKANPGKLFAASAGVGSAPHLASVGFEPRAESSSPPSSSRAAARRRSR